jgi:hypothetical protein
LFCLVALAWLSLAKAKVILEGETGKAKPFRTSGGRAAQSKTYGKPLLSQSLQRGERSSLRPLRGSGISNDLGPTADAVGLYLKQQVIDSIESHGFQLGVVDRPWAWFIETVR